ncbi:DUF4189 domain-containing protein [Bradyrhizobium vignae]|uniref:DUF4189 domain-containing protein n=1 Tax=Bradyrhizobium vignae TaxID=1549949 RepID=A0ABS3ZUB6_9BRAD|nr:DUF4189 domain-containing protein [Bradyrhizobium vignae]MBP0111759.1 DUF4189 domain-containing protein [Bradyrhizobium vignae]RXG91314.1 DUF4189 domain-containing protein [Bradyrhizobium vignae]
MFTRSLLALGAMLAIVHPVHAGESIWDHNGSRLKWLSDGQRRSAVYFEPREGLSAAGIEVGTVLFEGYRRGSALSGKSYLHRKGCPPASFDVAATITDERSISLIGNAPVRAAGCDVGSATKPVTIQLDFNKEATDRLTNGNNTNISSLSSEPSSGDIPKPSASLEGKIATTKCGPDETLSGNDCVPNKRYGALALSSTSRLAYGMSWDRVTASQAQADSMDRCRSNSAGVACRVILTTDACISLYWTSTGTGWGAVARSTAEEADRDAYAQCRSANQSCVKAGEFCNRTAH